jgi:non-specific serine/threonine protein kinase
MNGVLYVVGGIRVVNGGVVNVSAFAGFDIASGSWASLPPLPTARRGLAIAVDEVNQHLYAVGGMNCQRDCYGEDVQYLASVERYDARARKWTILPPMPSARREPTAAFLEGGLCICAVARTPDEQ